MCTVRLQRICLCLFVSCRERRGLSVCAAAEWRAHVCRTRCVALTRHTGRRGALRRDVSRTRLEQMVHVYVPGVYTSSDEALFTYGRRDQPQKVAASEVSAAAVYLLRTRAFPMLQRYGEFRNGLHFFLSSLHFLLFRSSVGCDRDRRTERTRSAVHTPHHAAALGTCPMGHRKERYVYGKSLSLSVCVAKHPLDISVASVSSLLSGVCMSPVWTALRVFSEASDLFLDLSFLLCW